MVKSLINFTENKLDKDAKIHLKLKKFSENTCQLTLFTIYKNNIESFEIIFDIINNRI